MSSRIAWYACSRIAGGTLAGSSVSPYPTSSTTSPTPAPHRARPLRGARPPLPPLVDDVGAPRPEPRELLADRRQLVPPDLVPGLVPQVAHALFRPGVQLG